MKLFWIVGAATALLAGNPAAAQPKVSTFYESGPWKVTEDQLTCYLSNDLPDQNVTLRIIQMRNLGPEMVISVQTKPYKKIAAESAIFRIDESFTLDVENIGGNNFSSMYAKEPLMTKFRAGKALSLTIDGTDFARFSLTGSAAAYRQLQRCVDQLYDGPVRPMRPPPPPKPPVTPIPEPDLEGPFDPDQIAKPLNGGAWVTSSDYPATALREEAEGIAAIRVLVGRDGTAKRCTVVRSSGHEALDKRSCSLILQRARFQPATDASGQLVESEWESAVRWTID